MDDPVKVIFKYKNDNRRTQYHIYIYVGDIPSSVLNVLKTIKEKSFLESLLETDEIDIKKLEKQYGSSWYKKFFNTYHLSTTIDIIKKSQKYSKDLITKFGKEWFDEHIGLFAAFEKKIFYSYDKTISEERDRKDMKRKIKNVDDDKIIDFRTIKPFNIANALKSKGVQTGGVKYHSSENNEDDIADDEQNIENEQVTQELFNQYLQPTYVPNTVNSYVKDYDSNMDTYNFANTRTDRLKSRLAKFKTQTGGEKEEDDDTIYDEYEDKVDDLDIEDLEKIYEDVYQDDEVSQTSKLIKSALDSDKAFKKEINSLLEFDKSKDKNSNDENLKDVYDKQYVTGIYIFKDDTIKMIKSKICCSILNNDKFGANSYLMPSRQYLFTEYPFNDIIEKIMLGQKWVRRNDLLKIDIEPNNIAYYEDLRGNLKVLKDNIKRYGNKIKWEDDDYNILYDYEDYFTNNEIYLMDIYNELGKKYNPDPEVLKNVTDVYINIYYRRIKNDDVKNIINYLAGTKNQEGSKMETTYNTINNDIMLEKYVMNVVEDVKRGVEYRKLFKENYITQSVIHVNLRLKDNSKINLYRIFNEFMVSTQYPFIQYQTQDGQINFKYSEDDINKFSAKKNNIDVLSKWFENAPYGISFKVKIKEKDEEKFMVINLNETGKIEYKTRWKEDDMATMVDIIETYEHIRTLLRKINDEKNKTIFELPKDEEFKYAFINSIQRFALPNNYVINHNDLSDFSRYFFPYVSLVIDPRKRQSKNKKNNNKSKFGTYLRFKRMQKYENNTRIEQRALYFMKHYDYTDSSLANEISKQFNLTIEKALESIKKVKEKYPNIKKSRKILKKLENVPKYKPPGIGIDIQGKQIDRYKIRISGARNKSQLNRIIQFMNILIFLYMETYLKKIPERQILKDKLAKLTNVAQRRNKVEVIKEVNDDVKSVKLITSFDKKRLGFRPEKGQNQWTRSCQNSGKEKRRRPTLYTSLDEVLEEGFKLNAKTGIYEKTVKIKVKGKMKDVVIRAVGLENSDNEQTDDEDTDNSNNEGMIYYSCNPKDNGEHMFIGFLSRSNNPFGQSMPCCFKKDPILSANKGKKDLYLKSLGKTNDTASQQQNSGEQLYILQDTNKIQEGRFGILPKYLDNFINQALGNERVLKQHHLVKTNGYFYKFGTKQEENQFLASIAAAYDKSVMDIKELIISNLEKDKNDILFNALNNGDIREKFITRQYYITFIKIGKEIEYDMVNHILSIPGIITKYGCNIVVFNKQVTVIKKTLEKEKVREDFAILCQNSEEVTNILSKDRDTIIMIKEGKFFYPIVKATKKNQDAKTVQITKTFKYVNEPSNIVKHISDFCIKSCETNYISDIKDENKISIAKSIYSSLQEKSKEYNVKYQIIDTKFKTKYLVTNNNIIVPTKPSGSIYNIPIKSQIIPTSFHETIKNLEQLNKVLGNDAVKPVGVYAEFDPKNKQQYKVIAIVANNNMNIPIISETIGIKELEALKFNIITKEIFDKIDNEIVKGKDNIIIDERIKKIKNDKYFNESYELFRLELSDQLNKKPAIKENIIKIKKSKDKPMAKNYEIRKILYKLIDGKLFNMFMDNVYSQKGGDFHIVNDLPTIVDYNVNNNRDLCSSHPNKDVCSKSPHCKWLADGCNFILTPEMAVKFINKVSNELINNDLRSSEILNIDNYFVSDIVDYNVFTTRPGQKIIKSSNTTLNKFLIDLFGKDNIPQIGKRRMSKVVEDSQDMNHNNRLQDRGNYFVQKIMDNNISTLRAYANGYYWVRNNIFDPEIRNLKYYSKLQTEFSSYFRSLIIDWLVDSNNDDIIYNELIMYIQKDYNKNNFKNILIEFIKGFSGEVLTVSNGIVEYYVMNKIFDIPIIVYNDQNSVLYVFDKGFVYDKFAKNSGNVNKKYTDTKTISSSINVKFTLSNPYALPSNIEVYYYS
jgi:hypothetical protein